MPNLKNAKKALRQAKKRAEENLVVKKAYKTALKEVNKAMDAGQKDVADLLKTAQKKLDKAAKKGVLKKNTASRKFSRLMAKVNTVAKKK
ncbi:30S ribosomal protein S20 [Candidatus Nomurabacteria bacterium]|nr:30S ribosomal protein S20 [Candidatus Nomurabacteria bacterium]